MVTPGAIKDVYFGFDLLNLFVRVLIFDSPAVAKASWPISTAVRIGFTEPSGFAVDVPVLLTDLSAAGSSRPFRLDHEAHPRALRGRIAKDPPYPKRGAADQIAGAMALPFELLLIKSDEPIQFFVELLQGTQSRDRAPREGTIHLTCPSPDFEQVMWDV